MTPTDKIERKTSFDKAVLATTGMASAIALVAAADAANAEPFDGLYFGLSAGSLSGRLPISENYFTGDYQLESQVTPGFFAGYNKNVGNGLVAGVELAMQGRTYGDANGESSYDNSYSISNLMEVKGRLGKVVSAGSMPLLVYGVGGFHTGTATNYDMEQYDFSGMTLGGGVEAAVTENFTVGLEVLHRVSDTYAGEYSATKESHNQVSLRAAFQF